VSLGEFDLIDKLLKPLAGDDPAALGLDDDAALLGVVPGRQLVVAKDAIVAGVHFLEDDPPESVAAKLLRVNLSDLAAMGAAPRSYLTVIARPAELKNGWLEHFARGLKAEQAAYGLSLIGGDVVSTTGPLVLTCTIIGEVPEGEAVLRRGARPGDDIWVSGTLGDAAAGLRVLKGLAVTEDEALYLADRYRQPQPRLALGQALRGVATAMIDISDGFVADLEHILESSGVGASIEKFALPLSPVARGLPGHDAGALYGGDDYELLFTAPVDRRDTVHAASRQGEVPVTRVGTVTAEPGLEILDEAGQPLPLDDRHGWRHF